jgi:hypothetical protein
MLSCFPSGEFLFLPEPAKQQVKYELFSHSGVTQNRT